MAKPVVGILMGSDSDLPVMQEAGVMLQEFGIEYEMTIASAHRTPKKVLEYSQSAEKRGLKVIIAGAGWAAHLAGVVASQTTLPVIGVPIDSSTLKGLDALLATVQMPGGVPVATMSIGKAGAKNAGVFAAQIIAVSDVKVANRLKVFKVEMEREVEEKAKRLVAIGPTAAPAKIPASVKESLPVKASAPAKAAAPAKLTAQTVKAEPVVASAPAKKKPRRRRWKKKPGKAGTTQGPAA
ncbi:MAG: 5-(carboxyamino)imidazole ribonucleotide mutase [Nitrospirae bacterium]|nr:5-(carboxyamino)imidazole ribonucleotide mutase [Nitrospirota bacterium]